MGKDFVTKCYQFDVTGMIDASILKSRSGRRVSIRTYIFICNNSVTLSIFSQITMLVNSFLNMKRTSVKLAASSEQRTAELYYAARCSVCKSSCQVSSEQRAASSEQRTVEYSGTS